MINNIQFWHIIRCDKHYRRRSSVVETTTRPKIVEKRNVKSFFTRKHRQASSVVRLFKAETFPRYRNMKSDQTTAPTRQK